MILRVHGVFVVCLALVCVWNVLASATPGRRTWWRGPFLALQFLLCAALLADRLALGAESWLARPWLAALFPLAFLAALIQNLAAVRERGLRLSDLPLLLGNLGLGLCVGVAGLSLSGGLATRHEAALLYDYSVLQLLLGSRQAETLTLFWHLPALCLRRRLTHPAALLAGLVVPALYGFVVVMLVTFRGAAEDVLASFGEPVPAAAARGDLATGVFRRAERPETGALPPGTHQAWLLPADHDGDGLARPLGPLVLALRAPDAWALVAPDAEQALEVFASGAVRLAGALRPQVLLPFPEPDGEAYLTAGLRLEPPRWRERLRDARRRVRAVSPDTRVAVRLASTSPFSCQLFELLATDPEAVDILGTRLQPAGVGRGGATWADQQLAHWLGRLQQRTVAPEFWILGAGASHAAYGASAQAAFARRCLALARSEPQVAGVLFLGWRDRGHTLGWVGPGDRPRPVLEVLAPFRAGR